MKHLVISTCLGIFLASSALADWLHDFETNLEQEGVEVAVEKALEIGKTPGDIVNKSMNIEGLNPQNVLKALYCEGVAGDDIKAAADDAEISEIIVVAAFNKSVAECGDQVTDSQAYTPAKIRFSGMPSPARSQIRRGSPATFD